MNINRNISNGCETSDSNPEISATQLWFSCDGNINFEGFWIKLKVMKIQNFTLNGSIRSLDSVPLIHISFSSFYHSNIHSEHFWISHWQKSVQVKSPKSVKFSWQIIFSCLFVSPGFLTLNRRLRLIFKYRRFLNKKSLIIQNWPACYQFP